MEPEDHTLGWKDEQMILTRRLSPIFKADQANGEGGWERYHLSAGERRQETNSLILKSGW